MVTAIIVAGGSGTRMGLELPKQFLKIGHLSILEETTKVFKDCEKITQLIIVSNDKHINYIPNSIVKDKYIKIVAGGETRQQSVYNGLLHVNKNCQIVLIHDSVRPFITNKNIEDCIKEAYKNNSCTLGVKPKDTIKLCDDNNIILDTPNRESLFCIQTPQAFKIDLIVSAHKKAIEENFFGTDDCILVERLGHKVKVIEGSYKNIKITTKEDLEIASQFLK